MDIRHRMLYTELSPEAQRRARESHVDGLHETEWWECTVNEWKAKLSELGFSDAEINFSGFSRQGDGASFTSGVTREFKLPEDLARRVEEATAVAKVMRRFDGRHSDPEMFWELTVKVQRSPHNSRYVHARTIDADTFLNFGADVPAELQDSIEAWSNELRGSLTEEARTLSDQIYRALESDWDAISSDESAAQNLIEAEQHFDEEGEWPECRRAA